MRITSILPLFAMAILLLMSAGGQAKEAPAGYYHDQKVVYLNDGGLPDNAVYFQHMLGSLQNHLTAVGKDHVDIRVVNLGPGVDMLALAMTDKDIAGQIDSLRAAGVRFLLCDNTLRGRKIDWHTLYGAKEGDIVPSGVAELARLQGMGFAYIHL